MSQYLLVAALFKGFFLFFFFFLQANLAHQHFAIRVFLFLLIFLSLFFSLWVLLQSTSFGLYCLTFTEFQIPFRCWPMDLFLDRCQAH